MSCSLKPTKQIITVKNKRKKKYRQTKKKSILWVGLDVRVCMCGRKEVEEKKTSSHLF
jgi:hypothetical protein